MKKKAERDILDILSLFKSVEPDLTPIFVARNLDKLPAVDFDHLDASKLLKDINILKNELRLMRETYVTTDELNLLRMDLENLKRASLVNVFDTRINTKRGTATAGTLDSFNLDSGPIGLTHIPTDVELSGLGQSYSFTLKQQSQHPSVSAAAGLTPAGQICSQPNQVVDVQRERPPAGDDTAELCDTVEVQSSENTAAHRDEPTRELAMEVNQPTTDWTVVRNKKSKKEKDQFLSKRGTASSSEKFKAAPSKVPLFLSNVHIDTSKTDIAEYIFNKTQEEVSMVQMSIKNDKRHKAFKIFVPRQKLDTYLDKNFWPEGIIYRRFIHNSKLVAERTDIQRKEAQISSNINGEQK